MDIKYTDEGMVINGELISWVEIDTGRNKLRFANSVLVTISFSYGRSSDFDDSFIIDKDEWATLKAEMLGKRIYFGEIAGKHSEVIIELEESDIKETTDPILIANFHARNGWTSGNVCVRSTYEDNKADGYYDE